MVSIWDTVVRVGIFVWSVIALGMIGRLINSQRHSLNQVNYAIFAAAWGTLFGGFFGVAAAFISVLALPMILLIVDLMTFVFLFAGATTLAQAMRCHLCTNREYVLTNKVTQGSKERCRLGQASIAFLYFGAFSALGLLGYQIYRTVTYGPFDKPTKRSRAAPRTGVPTMSQV